MSSGLRSYTGRLSFLRVPTEKIKEAAANDQYVDIEFQDSGNYDEDNDQKSTMNTDRNSNCSFGMESISLDTGCNQVQYRKTINTVIRLISICNVILSDREGNGNSTS